MVAITIRNVPDAVRDELAGRAARSGRSLQEYLAAQLAEMASRPVLDDIVTAARRRAHASGRSVAARDIIVDRDAERA